MSLLLDATGRHGPDAVRSCAMLLRHHAAELVVSHDGAGPDAAGLAALDGAILCVDTGGPAARAGRAARHARGRTLAFLRPDAPGGLCPSALARLLRHALPHGPGTPDEPCEPAGGGVVLAGQPLLSAARRAGLDLPFPVLADPDGTSSSTGLSLFVSRTLFAGLDGLDLSLDGVGLPFLDFALRAHAAGHEVLGWTEVAVPLPLPAPGAAAARDRFVRRRAAR